MLMTRRVLLAAAMLAGLCPALPAASAEAPYVTAARLDLVLFLPPPPVSGSALDLAEMREVVALQASRSPERAAQSKTDSDETIYVMFSEIVGPKFKAANLPKLDMLFRRVGASEDETVDPVKKVFRRPRPFQANPEVKPSAVISRSGSYPSGHATRSTMMGIIMAAMLPEKRGAIWARVDDYAESRVIGGVHYRSDIEAGKRAGTVMAAIMFADPAFRTDYEAARAELRTALGT